MGQYNLGQVYFLGIGVDRDIDEAIRLFRLAAESGNVHSIFSLGVALHSEGNAESRASARSWLRLAADMGHQEATRILAAQYGEGR